MVFKERTFHGEPAQEDLPQSAAGLEASVADTLATVDGLDASDVQVTLDGTTIILSGYVGTRDQIDQALEAARSVTGVADVVSRVDVVQASH